MRGYGKIVWGLAGVVLAVAAGAAASSAQGGNLSYPNLTRVDPAGQYRCLDERGQVTLTNVPCAERGLEVARDPRSTGGTPLFTDQQDGPGAYHRVRAALDALPAASSLERLNAYFAAGNDRTGARECRQYMHRQDLPARTAISIKRRDGYRCLVCGSQAQLSIDPIRALQNGGGNTPDNLALLCGDCAILKADMDAALRRDRERDCR